MGIFGRLLGGVMSPVRILFRGTVVDEMLGAIFGIIDKSTDDTDEAAKLKRRIKELSEQNELKELALIAEIVEAEIKSESWLQRSWRPLLMLQISLILFNTFLIAPYLRAFWNVNVAVPLPESLYDLLMVGVGGYVIGRSFEKGIRNLKDMGPIRIHR